MLRLIDSTISVSGILDHPPSRVTTTSRSRDALSRHWRITRTRHPREGGGTSTPRLIGSIIDVSGILGRPPSRTMTVEYDVAFSRRISPEVCIFICPPRNQRAQGRPGACCTRGLACDLRIARAAHEHTGQREHSGLPCAMALRLPSCSPRRTALLPPSPREKRRLSRT